MHMNQPPRGRVLRWVSAASLAATACSSHTHMDTPDHIASGTMDGMDGMVANYADTTTGDIPSFEGTTVTPSLPGTLWIPPALTATTFNLTLGEATKALRPGATTSTLGYNGMDFWGPTLILKKGDHVKLHVTNDLSVDTTTHWHGLHLPAAMDGGPHQVIAPGTTWSPEFDVMNHASLYWYHPHMHEHTKEQLAQGAGGFIIIQDDEEAKLALPRTYGVDDIPIVFSSRRFKADNQFDLQGEYGDFLMANGVIDATTTLPAQVVRLRLLNAETERSYMLGFADGRTFQLIGNDGGLLDAPVPLTKLMLSAGERVEILLDLSKEAPGATFAMQAFNGGFPLGFPGGEPQSSGNFGSLLNNKTFDMLKISVGPATADAITQVPQALVRNTYWTDADVTNSRTLSITDQGPGTPFSFDHASFNMDTINHVVALNAVEKWTIKNNRTFGHVFHIHDVQFKIVARSPGQIDAWEQGWKDTVFVPVNASVSFIARFDDFASATDPYMYHCHMSNHEDGGLMGQFLVK